MPRLCVPSAHRQRKKAPTSRVLLCRVSKNRCALTYFGVFGTRISWLEPCQLRSVCWHARRVRFINCWSAGAKVKRHAVPVRISFASPVSLVQNRVPARYTRDYRRNFLKPVFNHSVYCSILHRTRSLFSLQSSLARFMQDYRDLIVLMRNAIVAILACMCGKQVQSITTGESCAQ